MLRPVLPAAGNLLAACGDLWCLTGLELMIGRVGVDMGLLLRGPAGITTPGLILGLILLLGGYKIKKKLLDRLMQSEIFLASFSLRSGFSGKD